MASSISVNEKKRGRGRPRTGMHPVLGARVPADVIEQIDQWATTKECTRSEAVLALLKRGLEAVRAEAASASKASAGSKAVSRGKTHQRAR